MPSAIPLQRPFACAADLFRAVTGRFGKNVHKKLSKAGERKSRSTGDLDNADYMLMEPTTSRATPLPPHFDDCDRVPMEFSAKGVRLLPQNAATRKMLTQGSRRNSDLIPSCHLHVVQPWYYADTPSNQATEILRSEDTEDGDFIVYSWDGKLTIAQYRHGRIVHIPIAVSNRRGAPSFRINLDQAFKGVVELVEHYKHHKGYVLTHYLTRGIPRKTAINRS
ncbi:unnamed protein product, partial [Mesorhabditis spiculigera]